jgi:spore coat protein SA
MACSRPVVTAKGEETGHFVQQLNSGIVVDPTHPKKAAAYIDTLLTNDTLKEKLGALGRSAILNNYTWKHTAERIIKIYYED